MPTADNRKTVYLNPRIYIIDSQGHYYSKSGKIVTFTKTTPDKTCEVRVEYRPNSEEFYLRSWDGAYFQYHDRKPEHINQKNTKFNEDLAIPFTLVDLKPKNDFVFRASRGQFILPQPNEKNRICLGDFQNAKIKIGDPSTKRAITDIAYNVNSSTITELRPEVAFKTTIRNDSNSADFCQELEYSYLVSHVGSWTNSLGGPVPSESLVKTEIPCYSDGSVKITFNSNYPHTDTGLGTKVETKKVTTSVVVPRKHKGVATVYIYKALIKVPFTYTESVWYRGGAFTGEKEKGTYINVETFGVDVQITDLVSVGLLAIDGRDGTSSPISL